MHFGEKQDLEERICVRNKTTVNKINIHCYSHSETYLDTLSKDHYTV